MAVVVKNSQPILLRDGGTDGRDNCAIETAVGRLLPKIHFLNALNQTKSGELAFPIFLKKTETAKAIISK